MYVGDLSNTGFGTVSVGLLSHLYASGKYDILHVAVNYLDYEPAGVPWPTISAGFWHIVDTNRWVCDDPYGTMKIQKYVEWFDPDVIMVNNDFSIVDKYFTDPLSGEVSAFAKHRSKKILYAPLDSQPCPPTFKDTIDKWDKVIMYTYWQRKLMGELDSRFLAMPVMYHGIDLDAFHPMDKREAKSQLKGIFLNHNKKAEVPDFTKKYIVFFNGTNQFRKDLPVLFRAFAEFRKTVSSAFLIPQTNLMPADGGWYLPNLAGLTKVSDVLLMKHANMFSVKEMNVLFNAADVLAYPTRGEGFGLPHVEAYATKTPVIATDFGPQRELLGEDRGYKIKVKDLLAGINNSFSYFALPDYQDLARQLNHVYLAKDEVAQTVERAYEWVQSHTWQSKAAQLDKIITDLLGT